MPVKVAIQKMFHKNTTFIPEIASFSGLPHSRSPHGVQNASLLLVNGSTVHGFDHVSNLSSDYYHSWLI